MSIFQRFRCWVFGHRWFSLYDETGNIKDYDYVRCPRCGETRHMTSFFKRL